MATHPIQITESDSSTGALTLDDNGHSEVGPGDTIHWKIKSGSGVKKIISIDAKSGSTNIFISRPSPQGNIWVGNVTPRIAPCTIYVYSIGWEDLEGNRFIFDPIISIRPTKNLNLLFDVFLYPAIAFVAGAIASLLYWKMERTKLKKEIQNLKLNKH